MPRKYRFRIPKNHRKILVIDVGGTHVKFRVAGQKEIRRISSGPKMSPADMVAAVKSAVKDWNFEAVSIGYPGPVIHGRILHDPHNLGPGWIDFDFKKAFGCAVKIINDAAMQALGSYTRGRMLFLGLGTGLGSAMIVNGVLEPMELAHLPYRNGKTYEDYLGIRGLKRLGRKKWEHHVDKVARQLSEALGADDVVLGGGNAKKLSKVPAGVRLGNNNNAFLGGFRLWQREAQARAASSPV